MATTSVANKHSEPDTRYEVAEQFLALAFQDLVRSRDSFHYYVNLATQYGWTALEIEKRLGCDLSDFMGGEYVV